MKFFVIFSLLFVQEAAFALIKKSPSFENLNEVIFLVPEASMQNERLELLKVEHYYFEIGNRRILYSVAFVNAYGELKILHEPIHPHETIRWWVQNNQVKFEIN